MDGIPCDPRMNLMDIYVGIQSALVLAPGGLLLMLLKVTLNPIHTVLLVFMLVYGSHTVFCLLDDQKDWGAWKNEITRQASFSDSISHVCRFSASLAFRHILDGYLN